MPLIKKLVGFLESPKLLAVLLVSIAILGFFLAYNNRGATSSSPIIANTYSPGNYQFGVTPPISLGKLSDPTNSFINLHLNFYASNLDGYQNIFQTAPGNEGLRLEISGSTAALVLSDKLSTGGVKGLTISSGIDAKTWYELQVVAKNGSSISATLNGIQVLDYKSPGIELKGSDVLIGQGYDQSRKFHGLIKNITFEEGAYKRKSSIEIFNKLKSGLYLIGIFLLTYGVFSLFEKAALKFSNKTDYGFIGILCALFTTIFYNLIFFNKYFPLTEGWFSTYSLIIQNGGVPYRDFYLFLTPLYPLQISTFQEIFGNNFYSLRLLGLVVSVLTTLFLFLILRKFFTPLIACICTITAIIYYQSGVAFINYDFTQFLTLYCLSSTYFLVSIANDANSKYISINSFLSGLFASLAFLIKQSNGGIFLLFSFIAFLYIIFVNKKYNLIYIFTIGMALPIIAMIGYLYINSALPYFYQQVFNGAIESKGASLNDILFGWIRRLEFNEFISSFFNRRKVIITSLIFIIINTSILKIKKISLINQKYYQSFFITLYSFYAAGIIYIALNMGGLYEYILLNNKFNNITLDLQNITLIGIIALTLYSLLLRLLKPSSNPACFTFLLICLGLILGNGTSAGISEISLFLPFAFLVGTLMSFPDPTRLQRLFVSYLCLMLIFSLADSKFKAPYAWWYTSEPEIYDNSYETKIPLLAGMKLSASSALTLNEISDAITSHSSPSDDVFLFPNISGLYAITNRLPHSKSVVTWFDFLPDRLAKEEANRILDNPPKVIGSLVLPQKVWDAHESYFRGGKQMGQRRIEEAIETLTSKKNSPYSLIYTKQISPESKIEVWARN